MAGLIGIDVNEDRRIGTAGRVIMFGAALVVLIAGMRAALLLGSKASAEVLEASAAGGLRAQREGR
jgi:hypothetical protein